MTFQEFLKSNKIEATLFNDHGEAVYLGEASTVKSLRDRHWLRFDVNLLEGEFVFPFTKAIIHNGRRLYKIINISPQRTTKEITGIEVEVA